MFRDLPIRYRLSISFGVILVLMCAMVLVTAMQVNKARRTAELIALRLTPTVKASNDLALAVDRQRTGLRGYVLTGQARFLEEHKTGTATQQTAVDELRSRLSRGSDRRKLAQIELDLVRMRQDELHTLRLLGSTGKQPAMDYHQASVSPLAQDIVRQVSELSQAGHQLTQQAAQDFKAANERLASVAWGAFGMALLLTLIFALAITRSLARPVQAIATSTNGIARGDYSEAIALEKAYGTSDDSAGSLPRDEVRQIAVSIADMARVLQKREMRLKAHASIGMVCASTLDIRTLLDEPLAELCRTTGSQIGAVYVTNGDDELAVRGTYGLSDEAAEVALTGNDGFVEQAARTGEMVALSDIPEDTRFLVQPGLGKIIPDSIVCVPMAVPGSAMGVVVLASLQAYTQGTLVFMRTAVEQIGVALSNAFSYAGIQKLAEELRTTNEQLDTQNEELQCQNEEIQAQNEEIQAQSEELQAQNEEIQAQNEELSTQQTELGRRNEELESLTSDLAAIQSVTAVALSSLDQDELLGRLLETATGVLEMAFGMVLRLDEERNVLTSRAAHNIPLDRPLEVAVGRGFIGRIVQAREVSTTTDAQHEPLLVSAPVRRAGVRALIGIPLVTGDHLYGVALLGTAEPREFTEREKRFLEVFAERVAVAIERAQTYDEQRRLAETLQQSFLPSVLPVVPGFDIRDAYQPASVEEQVGGDFYDLIELPNGHFGIVMADVSGKGVDAAVYAAMAKHMLRAFALEDPKPGRVLERLNRVVEWSVHGEIFITVFYGVLFPHERRLVYANAGHDLPMFRGLSSCDWSCLGSTGPAIGILSDCTYKEMEVQLDHGSSLVLYTDGITEARRGKEFLGEQGLRDIISDINGYSARETVDHILKEVREYTQNRLTDDVALLVIKSESGRMD